MEEDKDLNIQLFERIARLEADVAWLKKLSTTNLLISASSLITILIMILYLILS